MIRQAHYKQNCILEHFLAVVDADYVGVWDRVLIVEDDSEAGDIGIRCLSEFVDYRFDKI